jgi:beta-N-acetylhexosaminidase
VATRHRIGQLIVGSLPGPVITPELRTLARDFQLGGVILFARNVESPEQVAELSRELQTLAATGTPPLWVSVDQEGGRVARLRSPFTEWPPMATLGRSGDEDLALRFARALAAELRAVGITLDYAPVLDVHTNSANPVIGDRALSEDTGVVARLGGILIETLQAGGVAACGKHFPGHGDTSVDSHAALPIVEHAPDRLQQVEFVPFREAVRRRAAFIMTAHVLVPSIDEEYPATLSSAIVDDLLKGELGFEGAILSDDLEMRAVTDRYAVPDAAVLAVAAGCDGVLVPHGDVDLQVATAEALIHGIEDKRIPWQRLEDAHARMAAQKARFLGALNTGSGRPTAVLGCEIHRRIADEMAKFA